MFVCDLVIDGLFTLYAHKFVFATVPPVKGGLLLFGAFKFMFDMFCVYFVKDTVFCHTQCKTVWELTLLSQLILLRIFQISHRKNISILMQNT